MLHIAVAVVVVTLLVKVLSSKNLLANISAVVNSLISDPAEPCMVG